MKKSLIILALGAVMTVPAFAQVTCSTCGPNMTTIKANVTSYANGVTAAKVRGGTSANGYVSAPNGATQFNVASGFLGESKYGGVNGTAGLDYSEFRSAPCALCGLSVTQIGAIAGANVSAYDPQTIAFAQMDIAGLTVAPNGWTNFSLTGLSEAVSTYRASAGLSANYLEQRFGNGGYLYY